MEYIVNTEEMRLADGNTSAVFGLSGAVLMERAALEVVDAVVRDYAEKGGTGAPRVLIFAGTGGNGGDGIAAARILHQRGSQTLLVLVGEIADLSPAARDQLDTAMKYCVPLICLKHPDEAEAVRMVTEWRFDHVIDAIFGIGVSRPLTGIQAVAVSLINRLTGKENGGLTCVSIDMPSGIDTDTGEVQGIAVKADITVTMDHKKRGLVLYPGASYAGRIVKASAGITAESFLDRLPLVSAYDEAPGELLPVRNGAFNKGDYGKLLIIAGNGDIGGAPVLCARGAMAAGAAMIRVFTEKKNRTPLLQTVPEALVDVWDEEEPVDRTRERLENVLPWAGACVIGPGIGTDARAKAMLTMLLFVAEIPLVIDADACNLIAGDEGLKELLKKYEGKGILPILTPHVGEFSRLSGRDISDVKKNIIDAAYETAQELRCTVLLKDARSVTAHAGRRERMINLSGNSGMATAGSGDVLAGIIGALSLRGTGAGDPASVGAYIHGLAGDAAAASVGEAAMTAGDIAQAVREVLR